jgi:hypothetical protein
MGNTSSSSQEIQTLKFGRFDFTFNNSRDIFRELDDKLNNLQSDVLIDVDNESDIKNIYCYLAFQGFNLDLEDKRTGLNALHLLAMHGLYKTFIWFIENFNTEEDNHEKKKSDRFFSKCSGGKTLVHMLMSGSRKNFDGRIKILTYISEKFKPDAENSDNIDVNSFDDQGDPALFYATEPAMIDNLIIIGADPRIKNCHKGFTVLHRAIGSGNYDTFKYIKNLLHGLKSINSNQYSSLYIEFLATVENNGNTVLHWMTFTPNKEIAYELLKDCAENNIPVRTNSYGEYFMDNLRTGRQLENDILAMFTVENHLIKMYYDGTNK